MGTASLITKTLSKLSAPRFILEKGCTSVRIKKKILTLTAATKTVAGNRWLTPLFTVKFTLKFIKTELSKFSQKFLTKLEQIGSILLPNSRKQLSLMTMPRFLHPTL